MIKVQQERETYNTENDSNESIRLTMRHFEASLIETLSTVEQMEKKCSAKANKNRIFILRNILFRCLVCLRL